MYLLFRLKEACVFFLRLSQIFCLFDKHIKRDSFFVVVRENVAYVHNLSLPKKSLVQFEFY